MTIGELKEAIKEYNNNVYVGIEIPNEMCLRDIFYIYSEKLSDDIDCEQTIVIRTKK